ncbi:polysaccharide biosynthesis/export family protein [Hyphomicrobium sp. MC8b]|uniref:polysaccharide biosynthesis/export family protein n=1 Tax=Hyphomicrobium sp. MC8b TaxID=300273 RepID=UPI00391CA4CC
MVDMGDVVAGEKMRILSFVSALIVSIAVAGCGASLQQSPHFATASSTRNSQDGPGPEQLKPAALGGQEAHVAEELASVSNPSSSAYKIGPMDVVDISVFQVPELSKTVQVDADGTINLPLVGKVRAAGLTPGEVENDLTHQLGKKYLQSPQVNVYIKEYNSQRVTVDGAVKRPGVYPLHGPATLLQVIATAEGFTDTADSTVAIFRTENGERSAARFNVGDIRSGNAKDPEIHKGDVVVVSNSTMKEGYQALLKVLPVSSLFVSVL